MKISEDTADLVFRLFFCLIFVGLGAEHMFSDELIQRLMPGWVPTPRLVSFMCGAWLFTWGSLIAIGFRVKWAAIALGAFVIAVTIAVHAPGVLTRPVSIPQDAIWMWDILQRTNLVKNICLLGVCFHLLHHEVGKYSLEMWLEQFKPR